MRKAFVLLSGGLDSTTCLHKAMLDYHPTDRFNETDIMNAFQEEAFPLHPNWVEAISINYGQRHIKEARYALATCERLGIQHTILDLPGLGSVGTMLTDSNVPVPNISYSDIKGVSPTYVPFRNGNLLSRIAAHAQLWVNAQIQNAEQSMRDMGAAVPSGGLIFDEGQAPEAGIYFGAHSEDAQNWAYPDCTPEFIGAMANAIFIGTYKAVRLHTPLQWLMKSEIVALGAKLGVRFEDTWSCYKGEEFHCGICPTCRSRREAFVKAGVPDPTHYAVTMVLWEPGDEIPF